MLTIERRHLRTCPILHKGGRVLNKCTCPLRAVGTVKNERIRKTLDTCNLDIAWRKVRAMESDLESGKVRKPFNEAVEAFLRGRTVEASSLKKYRRSLVALCTYSEAAGTGTVRDFNLEQLDGFRDIRPLSVLSWSKELQLLRTFFKFCMKRQWCDENVAAEMDMPQDPKPKPRQPFTTEEVIRIMAAADVIGQTAYERQRAKAMLLVMNFYALRIGDVATLKRDRIANGQIFLHALKNGAPIWLPLYPEVSEALDALPLPEGATADCPYFFWTGNGSLDSLYRGVARTLTSVFRRSKVPNASAHRFRHTLATKILVNGGTIEDAANILGDSPAVVYRHYAKWSADYQHRTAEVLRKAHRGTSDTELAHEKIQGVSPVFPSFEVVAREGLEPPTRGFSVRCSTN